MNLDNEIAVHGPVSLVPFDVFLGSTLRTVQDLHKAASTNDKISGFYVDNGVVGKQRCFYLENVTPSFTHIEQAQPSVNLGTGNTVCILHQPHQPPMVSKLNS